MIRKIHLSNAANRDATVSFTGLRPEATPRPGLVGREVRFLRFLGAAESGTHEALQARYGEDYGQALVDGDPEVDLEQVGRRIGRTDTVYLSATGDVLYSPPNTVEIVLGPDGDERERRSPEDREANINDPAFALRWTGRKLPVEQVVRGFVIARTVQVRHVDGLSFDYLSGMAKELAAEGAMVMVGAGPKGRDPLIFSTNGSPYRGFLEGRVDGDRYMLLLHLSNMELKRPETAAGGEG